MFDVKDSDFFELEEEDFDTVLADDITFTGKITFTKPFMIKGVVHGSIEAQSDLVIDTNATVEANIVAQKVLVRGTVVGDISAKKMIFVTASGEVKGNLSAAEIVLEPGSTFTGHCTKI
ncbi:MAG TPA: polymer-forming cytoskeletal protein [Treponemataceae bacterium]|nr:polymer-forming cytoskeletal protein [Treponemataceae bacterium]